MEGIPTDSRNSGITTYTGLLENDRSCVSIEFRYGIPESQLVLTCLRMISPGYRSNSATEFPELEGPGITNDQSLLSIEFRYGIPRIGRNSRNSGITTYMGLFTNDQSWLCIEFRCGIPWRNCFLPSSSLPTMYMVKD